MATGVLVIGIERATKLLGQLSLTDKAYEATIRLGQATVTDDAEGDVTATMSADSVSSQMCRQALGRFVGSIDQVPSSVSAIKVDGRRSYARVRAGEQVKLAARRVTIQRLDMLDTRRAESGCLDVDVSLDCSTGTYVRALARDLGATLGVGGHLTRLRRTRVGPFDLSRALTLDELGEAASVVTIELSAAVATCFPQRQLSAQDALHLSHGRSVQPAGIPGTYGVFDPGGAAIALVEERDGAARPVVVLRPAD